MDPIALTIGDAAAALQRGEMTARGAMPKRCSRRPRAPPALNAFIHHDPDAGARRGAAPPTQRQRGGRRSARCTACRSR